MTFKKPSPFTPAFLKSAIQYGKPLSMTFSQVKDTNIASTSSFVYDSQDAPLKSTQQLNVDWSNFENHTFFMSAEAKVNLAFEQIINGFPFDGTRSEVEQFFEKLSGFDKWVFDSFPKYKGQLHFSGTQTSETSPTLGTYINVQDYAGALYSELAKNPTGESILNPRDDASLSIEAQVFIPSGTTISQQVICQKLNGSTQGFSLYLMSSPDTSATVEARFSVVSGSTYLTVPGELRRGQFNHICVTFNKENGPHYLEFFRDGTSLGTSRSRAVIDNLDIDTANLIIGSGTTIVPGSTFTPAQTFSGSIDEFRIFHSVRSTTQQLQYAKKSIFATPDLKLYYRFNEPAPPLATDATDQTNSIVIDSSGNALHAVVSNFTGSLRQDASTDDSSNMVYEKLDTAPVLFPGYADVVDLNTVLLVSASAYDKANPNLITKLVPPHYLLEGSLFDGFEEPEARGGAAYAGNGIPGEGELGGVHLFLSLLYIWARFFDEMKLYIDAFSKLKTVDYDTNVSVPNNFLHDLIRQYGFNLPPLFTDSTLEQYVWGENIRQDIISNSDLSLKQVQNELLRRIMINLPDVIRSKGTQHSIKSFLRAVGIDPENSLRLREYGGPTTRQLSYSRESKRDVGAMVKFITSSLAKSPYLSGSRTEPGYPIPAGTFVTKPVVRNNVSGTITLSNNASDGLFTSGSWTVETIVRYGPAHVRSMTSATQSLVRMCVTGSMSGNEGLIANLIAVSSSTDPHVSLYFRPGNNESSPLLHMSMSLPLGALFDGDKWNVSFGCSRNDSIDSRVSSSYFLRVGNQNNGDITNLYATSSFFNELITSESNSLRTISSFNTHGAFLVVGENHPVPSGTGNTYLYLNNIPAASSSPRVPEEARSTGFTGLMSNLRFWSKDLSLDEWKEHVRNYKSTGVSDPLVNYNFVTTRTGSFEKLRLDTMSKQYVKRANATASYGPLGTIQLLDFSLNGLHLTGTGFPIDSDTVRAEAFDYSFLSPRFDEATTNEKVRVRSFQNQDLIDSTPWASAAPVYELVASEKPTDDVRFSIEFSLIDALNRDIVTMFATFDALESAIGAPELIFAPDYPDLDKLRDVYFNRISEKLNFKAFLEFYRWFDMSIGTFIQQLIPRKTNFKGTNYVVESHMLERAKLEYLQNEQYLGVSDRNRIKDVLLLQQIAGTARKY